LTLKPANARILLLARHGNGTATAYAETTISVDSSISPIRLCVTLTQRSPPINVASLSLSSTLRYQSLIAPLRLRSKDVLALMLLKLVTEAAHAPELIMALSVDSTSPTLTVFALLALPI
jgi:hypothetical protein